ncbi:MAG: hypothetical protein IJ192_04135 [Clostridia bacterium]|nr:hypothetical protein [Clostridia bacterium]
MTVTIITAVCLCIVEFVIILLVAPMAKPSMILGFLPEDIREKAKNHPEPPKHKQIIAYILFIIFIASFIGAIVFLGIDGLKNDYDYWRLAGRFLLVLYINKAFDIIVQDQWLVMSTDYFKKIFPETADCDGWHDRGFNNKNQLKRILGYPFLCLITAGIFMLFK